MGLQLFNMENKIKVIDITVNITQGLIVKIEGDVTGLPKAAVMKEIEKALNKVKPLDIPTL